MTKAAAFRREATGYALGLVLALGLTGAAFAVVAWRPWHLSPGHALAVVFLLGLIQIIVHFRYFLHIGFRKSTREDLQLILFSTLIIVLMVSGTLVIMLNLRHRMM